MARNLFLHNLHVQKGAMMGEFGGWLLPFSHSYHGMTSIEVAKIARTSCCLFDVSHMMQSMVTGSEATSTIEKLIPIDAKRMELGQSKLGLFLNQQGGIIDDAIIIKLNPDAYRIVSNASRRSRLLQHFSEHGFDKMIEETTGYVLLALQGPKSAEILKKAIGYASVSQKFMTYVKYDNLIISRCGYTGEDGFEVMVPNERAEELAKCLLSFPEVILAGLIVRDFLRIEAGLLLNGQDMNEQLVPSELGLQWTISKSRGNAGFIGAPLPLLPKKLYGIIESEPGRVPRCGNSICTKDGITIGHVTSGCYSPNLGKNIALALIQSAPESPNLKVNIRGKEYVYEMKGLPFIKHQYKK